MASIIEKEAATAKERKKISSVLHNRLKKRMRLQMDPTVFYGLDKPTRKLTSKDMRTKHKYNTYYIRGLPPTPICSPGLQSIKAVLWPDKTTYLYFVSKNDGTHRFCRNYRCHQKAVRKWQFKR